MQQASAIVEPARQYRGAITDTARWRAFSHRPGDVFVCAPPKCGTTWTQTIVTMLLLDGPDLPAPIAELSPWFDAGLPEEWAALTDLETMTAALEARTTRRCIKTHTPADGIPLRDDAIYVAVYRHPIDVFFSLRKHLTNMKGVRENHPITGEMAEAFANYLAGDFDPDACDDDSLAAMVAHYDSFVRAGRVPNLLVLHYADMLRDPEAAVARLAEHVGVSPEPEVMQAIIAATRLDNMRADAGRYAPFGNSDLWHDTATFFHRARQGAWEGRLTPDDLAAYAERMDALLPAADRMWLESGMAG